MLVVGGVLLIGVVLWVAASALWLAWLAVAGLVGFGTVRWFGGSVRAGWLAAAVSLFVLLLLS